MTKSSFIAGWIPLVADLSRDMPERERYGRLLEVIRQVFPCDAVALLKLQDDYLLPLAVIGLSPDTLGRRFRVSEHPRFQELVSQGGATRFPSDCGLPDPYDGLVEGQPTRLEVHDCLGCALYLQDQLWGLLTLDSLDPASFGNVDLAALEAFSGLAAATVMANERIAALTSRIEDERTAAEVYRHAVNHLQPRSLVGQSAALRHLQGEIALVGKSDLTVLIAGETGVGKELVAEAIHAASNRARRPMLSLNCAALPENLVESELFGHVRGAFSGAISDRRGKFELANAGTLFLDEVGELPLTVQAKLLRVLQSGQLQRLGSDQEHHVNVRLIAATNRDLVDRVREGLFRADLYHRLAVYPIRVPPLRERGRDVLLLAGTFLEENRNRLGLRSLRLSAESQMVLLKHNWLGNVRELEHLISRAALKAMAVHMLQPEPTRMVTIDVAELDLPGQPPNRDEFTNPGLAEAANASMNVGGLRDAVDAFQRRRIEEALERHQGRWANAARELQLDRANLARLARRLGIR
ncbi:anaerobic nitric oxide reductase transcription regulator [Cupriavidus sp. YR651]|uniref:nitric oxide reductase transcriptional regulator NorR n=1 Tax=Cupriavidus sp. YR651 TaxID=1855315 RepID=UPI00088DFB1E|nr:nitric oxide reductase transcriptional regulator NorR [Cupriavidus sp. YR651]SDD95876.1 anaerobic nitric oxide reductase transcription regulator [Cupriavidus sp. YR651]